MKMIFSLLLSGLSVVFSKNVLVTELASVSDAKLQMNAMLNRSEPILNRYSSSTPVNYCKNYKLVSRFNGTHYNVSLTGVKSPISYILFLDDLIDKSKLPGVFNTTSENVSWIFDATLFPFWHSKHAYKFNMLLLDSVVCTIFSSSFQPPKRLDSKVPNMCGGQDILEPSTPNFPLHNDETLEVQISKNGFFGMILYHDISYRTLLFGSSDIVEDFSYSYVVNMTTSSLVKRHHYKLTAIFESNYGYSLCYDDSLKTRAT